MNVDIDSPDKYFFPREMRFWLYNTAGWGLLFLYLITITVITTGNIIELITDPDFYIVLFGCIEGTLAGLLFRFFYYRREWYQLNFIKILPFVFLIALVCSLLFGLTIVISVYYSGGAEDFVSQNSDVTLTRYLFGVIVGNGAVSFTLVTLWCFIYLSIKSAQNTRELSRKTLALENHLKEARLNVLSAQINPHFLFNALNNIRFMIHENASRADESLISLSDILRHSLDSSKKEKMPLQQELAIVKQYLELMKNQMEDRLSYLIEVDPLVEAALIPPMIIQMLAENAIKHGIEHQKNGGQISVRCRGHMERLLIQVNNTTEVLAGDGISNEKEDANDSGLGLENITTRLKLLYGSDARLSIAKELNQVIVNIDIPKELII